MTCSTPSVSMGLSGPRFTVHVSLSDHANRYWIVVEDDASICLADPGFEVDVVVRSDRRSLYEVYLGRSSLAGALRSSAVELEGSRVAVRAFTKAFRQSPVGEIVATESGSPTPGR